MRFLCDEAVPKRSVDYFRKLDKATVKVHSEEQQVSGWFDE